MERTDALNHIAIKIEDLIRTFGRRKDICVTFSCLTDETIEKFSEWNRKYFSLHSGEECFFIWEDEDACASAPKPHVLLYVVNVTGDSLLTAAGELMDLVSRKF